MFCLFKQHRTAAPAVCCRASGPQEHPSPRGVQTPVRTCRSDSCFNETELSAVPAASADLHYLDSSGSRNVLLVQDSAARLSTKTKHRSHIPPVLVSLHQLPVTVRTDFKTSLWTYEASHAQVFKGLGRGVFDL